DGDGAFHRHLDAVVVAVARRVVALAEQRHVLLRGELGGIEAMGGGEAVGPAERGRLAAVVLGEDVGGLVEGEAAKVGAPRPRRGAPGHRAPRQGVSCGAIRDTLGRATTLYRDRPVRPTDEARRRRPWTTRRGQPVSGGRTRS